MKNKTLYSVSLPSSLSRLVQAVYGYRVTIGPKRNRWTTE